MSGLARKSGAPALAAMLVSLGLLADTARAAEPTGQSLYAQRCCMCHQTIGMAVSILSRRPADASKGLLEERNDLSAAVVKAVVRSGIVNMPRISRAEVSDPELTRIAEYLSKGKP